MNTHTLENKRDTCKYMCSLRSWVRAVLKGRRFDILPSACLAPVGRARREERARLLYHEKSVTNNRDVEEKAGGHGQCNPGGGLAAPGTDRSDEEGTSDGQAEARGPGSLLILFTGAAVIKTHRCRRTRIENESFTIG